LRERQYSPFAKRPTPTQEILNVRGNGSGNVGLGFGTRKIGGESGSDSGTNTASADQTPSGDVGDDSTTASDGVLLRIASVVFTGDAGIERRSNDVPQRCSPKPLIHSFAVAR
jgi:hypothetical protein